MMIKTFFIVMLVAMPALAGRAATYADPVEGRLKSVYSDFITVEVAPEVSKSPDANPANGEMAFTVDTQTGYDGINKLSDLKQGDRVSVEYKEGGRSAKNVATMIRKVEEKTTVVVTPAPAAQVITTTTPDTSATTVTTTTTVSSP